MSDTAKYKCKCGLSTNNHWVYENHVCRPRRVRAVNWGGKVGQTIVIPIKPGK